MSQVGGGDDCRSRSRSRSLGQHAESAALTSEPIVEVSTLSGQTWRIPVSNGTTGAELRNKVAQCSGIDEVDVLLVSGDHCIADDEVVSSSCLQLVKGQRSLCVAREIGLGHPATGRQLHVWDILHGVRVLTLPHPGDEVFCADMDWDARRIISGDSEGVLELWDLSQATCMKTLKLGGRHEAVQSMVMNWNSRLAFSVADDCLMKLWDLDSGVCCRTFRDHHASVNAIAVNWLERFVVTGSEDTTLKVCHLAQLMDAKPKAAQGHGSRSYTVRTLRGHKAVVSRIAVDWDAWYGASGDSDGEVRIWNLGPRSGLQGQTAPSTTQSTRRQGRLSCKVRSASPTSKNRTSGGG